MRQFIVTSLLVSFLTLAFFSSAAMMHGQNGYTVSNCPFSAMGTPLCSGNTLASVLHHVSLYHSFFNVLVSFGVTAGIMLLIVALAVAVFSTSPPLSSLRSRVFRKSSYDAPLVSSYERKLARWFSLFEHSPSF